MKTSIPLNIPWLIDKIIPHNNTSGIVRILWKDGTELEFTVNGINYEWMCHHIKIEEYWHPAELFPESILIDKSI